MVPGTHAFPLKMDVPVQDTPDLRVTLLPPLYTTSVLPEEGVLNAIIALDELFQSPYQEFLLKDDVL